MAWSNESKSSSSFTNSSKNASVFDDGVDFLLTELLSFLLLESSGKIVLDQSTNYIMQTVYTNQAKY